jgi:hypothetical protein
MLLKAGGRRSIHWNEWQGFAKRLTALEVCDPARNANIEPHREKGFRLLAPARETMNDAARSVSHHRGGRREVDGLAWVGDDRLIPLKVIAWLELTARKEQGAKVDAKDVRKHLNDVLRLSQLLAPATRIAIDEKIGDDMTRFLVAVAADTSIDPKALKLGNVAVPELVARISQAYEIELPAQAAG